MRVKTFLNENAKTFVRKRILPNNTDSIVSDVITNWMGQDAEVECYALYDGDDLVSFAILSKCDFDPIRVHTNPYIIDFIHTTEKMRRNGHGRRLLEYIRPKHETTAFCIEEISEYLFKSAGFTRFGVDPMMNVVPVYRFP